MTSDKNSPVFRVFTPPEQLVERIRLEARRHLLRRRIYRTLRWSAGTAATLFVLFGVYRQNDIRNRREQFDTLMQLTHYGYTQDLDTYTSAEEAFQRIYTGAYCEL